MTIDDFWWALLVLGGVVVLALGFIAGQQR